MLILISLVFKPQKHISFHDYEKTHQENSTKIFRILFALWGEEIFGVDLIWPYESKFKALISIFQNKI